MITRARERIVVVTSVHADVGGLLGEWLVYSEHAPHPPAVHDPQAGWAAALAGELRRAGLEVRGHYPVGLWEVDLCVGTGDDAVGLCCTVHTDGVVSHVHRMLELRRSGWRIVDAYPSLWDGDEVRAALDLVPRLAR